MSDKQLDDDVDTKNTRHCTSVSQTREALCLLTQI